MNIYVQYVSDLIVALFWRDRTVDHPKIWQLYPCVHLPSFLPQYWARKDELDAEFLTVALAILTVSLSHVPNRWLQISEEGLADLMRSCLGGLEKLVDDMLEVGV
jgi:hypothetical protein